MRIFLFLSVLYSGMLDEKVVALLNQQVNKEFYSAYLYLEISNFYDSISLDGFANW